MYSHQPKNYDCPFCHVVQSRWLPEDWVAESDVILRTEHTVAFVAPVWWRNNPGHVLVVPNRHSENLYVLPTEDAAAIHETVQRVALAMKSAYGCEGISTRQHNEPAGNQDVWHYHVHVFPRHANDDLYLSHNERRRTTPEERSPYAERLRAALKETQPVPVVSSPNPQVVIFRSRLRPESADEYATVAPEIGALAKQQPGIIAVKTFTASDGERLTIAEFADAESVKSWRENTRHQEAQAAGRERFYSEYRLQVCDVLRDYGMKELPPPASPSLRERGESVVGNGAASITK